MAIDDIPLPHDPLAHGPAAFGMREAAPSHPGEAATCVDTVAGALPAVRRLADISTNLTDAELTAAARSALAHMQQTEALVVALTTDAIDRGLVTSSTAADAAQWIGRLSRGESISAVMGEGGAGAAGPLVPIAPEQGHATDEEPEEPVEVAAGLEPGHCSRLAKLAQACRAPKNALVLDAIISGRTNAVIAATALHEIGPVSAILPGADRDDLLGAFLCLPPGSGARAVRELTRRIVARFADADQSDAEEDTMQRHESLSWSNLPNGLVRLIADLSPDNAEKVKHAIQAMAAPSPSSDCCDNVHHNHRADEADGDAHHDSSKSKGEPDLRTPGKRRADAFTELIRIAARAVDNDGQIKSAGTARIVVTIDFEHLSGALAGLGYGQGGVGITPDTVRQLACDAEIIPMVLGSKNQPLNVGRKRRLVDKELRAAVIQRDRHCTHPGCTRPPVMCEVHHVKYWWHGGETSLLNSALLCSTHHRIVHRDNLTATVTAEGVTWHPAGEGVRRWSAGAAS